MFPNHKQEGLLDFNNTPNVSTIQSTVACESKAISSSTLNTQYQSSQEPKFVIGPAFSLADCNEDGSARQRMDTSNIKQSDSSQPLLISNVQTVSPGELRIQSLSVSTPTTQSYQEPQICIGSVFSLADDQKEHMDHKKTNSGPNLIAAGESQETAQGYQALSAVGVNLKNVSTQNLNHIYSYPHTSSSLVLADPAPAKSDTASTITTKYSEISKILNKLMVTQTSVSSTNTGGTNIFSKSVPIQTFVNVLPKPCSINDIVMPIPISTDCTVSNSADSIPTSTVPEKIVSSTMKNTNDLLTCSSNQQPEGTLVKPDSELRNEHMNNFKRTNYNHVPGQDILISSAVQPDTSKNQEPEVVDLDAEDIDDCLLVKIDLSRHFFPYGSKINNIEVVIDDSDNDEDVATIGENADLSPQSVALNKSCDASSSSSKIAISSEHKILQNDVCSTMVESENDTGPLNMEVEEISGEVEPLVTINFDQAVVPCNTYETEATAKSPMDMGQRVTDILTSNSLLDTVRDNKIVPSKLSSEIIVSAETDNSKCHMANVPQLSTVCDTSNSEYELMELQVEDETPLSTDIECTPVKLLAPSKFSPQDSNLSIKVPESVAGDDTSFVCSSISFIKRIVTDMHADLQNSVQIALQVDRSKNAPNDKDISHESISGQSALLMTKGTPEKCNLELASSSKQETQGKSLGLDHVALLKEKKIKGAKKPAKQSSVPTTANRFSNNSITTINDASVETKIVPKACSIVCKLCFMSFPSRMELVTHTWNCHRQSQYGERNPSIKCKICNKLFINEALLRLHYKIKCHLDGKQRAVPGSSIESSKYHAERSTVKESCLKSMSPERCHEVQAKKTNLLLSVSAKHNNQPRENEDSCDNDVDFVKSEIDFTIVHESLLPSKEFLDTEMKMMGSNQTECCSRGVENVRGDVELQESLTHCFASSAGERRSNDAEQEHVTPSTDFSTDTEQSFLEPEGRDSGSCSNEESLHECCYCYKKFANKLQLLQHQDSPGTCKLLNNTDTSCFVCAKTFTEPTLKYVHMWNNPECKEGISRYCSKCSSMFKDPSDKQAHLSLSQACWLYEMQLTKDVIRSSVVNTMDCDSQKKEEIDSKVCQTLTPHNVAEQDLGETAVLTRDETLPNTDSSLPSTVHCELSNICFPNYSDPNEHFQLNSVCKNQSDKLQHKEENFVTKTLTEVQNEGKPNIMCPGCKRHFATDAVLILHLNDSIQCKKKLLQPPKVAKKQSLTEVKSTPGPVSKIKHHGKEISKNVKNKRHGKEISKNVENKTSSSKQAVSSNIPISASDIEKICVKNLTITLVPLTVMCKACHIPFTDNLKLAEHFQTNQACLKMYPKMTTNSTELKELIPVNETIRRDVKKRKLIPVDETIKRDAKKPKLIPVDETIKRDVKKPKSCEIVTGISSTTSTVSMMCRNGGCISVTENPSELDSKIEEKQEVNEDVHVMHSSNVYTSSSSIKQVCVSDQGNKEDNGNLLFFDDLSSSDGGSGTETASSEDDDDAEYTCKLCSKTFASRTLFIKHKVHHHTSLGKMIHCKVCTRKFHDLTGLQAHLLQFRFCFIPLTKTLWERKQNPQFCNMCKKTLNSPKELRRHCFKNMACRLRYVNVVLSKVSHKDQSKESTDKVEFTDSKTQRQYSDNRQNANVVLPDQDNDSSNHVDNTNTAHRDIHSTSSLEMSKAITTPLRECINCGKTYSDFLGHLFKQQACLDFYGIHKSKCPVPLPFCFHCKTRFESTDLLKNHICEGIVAYTHLCQICGQKFINEKDLNIHIEQSTVCSKEHATCAEATKHQDKDMTVLRGVVAEKHHDETLSQSATKTVKNSAAQSVHSAEQSFPCMICDAKFPTLRYLMEHSYQHEEDTLLNCERCNITFLHYNQFVSHQVFHVRMDKESSMVSATSNSDNVPLVVEKSGSTDPSSSDIIQGDLISDQKISNHVSVCIFCHQNFSNEKTKVDHISKTSVCLGIMRYIVENKFFIKDSEGSKCSNTETVDSKTCEFCHHNFANKISHYLQSACLNRLEEAILRYRASPLPSEPAESVVINNESKETSHHNFSLASRQNIHLRNHNPVMYHPIEQEYLSGKLPPEDTMKIAKDEPEVLYCVLCKKYLRTVMEVENHQSKYNHGGVVPHGLVKFADFRLQSLRCKICNSKFAFTGNLISHMIKEHYDGTNILIHTTVQGTSLCTICNRHVFASKLHHHFEDHKKAFIRAVKIKCNRSLTLPSNELCRFCKRTYTSRKNLLKHLQTAHIFSQFFISENDSKAEVVSKNENVILNILSKFVQEKKELDTILYNAENMQSMTGKCLLCCKQFESIELFKIHFQTSHQFYDQERYKEYFSLIEFPGPKTDVVTSKDFSSVQSVPKKDKSGSNKSPQTCFGSGSVILDTNMSDKNCHTTSQKTTKICPIGSCKMCHQNFINIDDFKLHMKTSHTNIAADPMRYFRPLVLLGHEYDSKNTKSDHSAFLKLENQTSNFCTYSDIDVSSNTKQNIYCSVCTKTFDSPSLLKSHQRKEHEHTDDGKSPLQVPNKGISDGKEEVYCFTCKTYFRTLVEVKKHQSLKHSQLLPASRIKYGDWNMQHLRCKICDVGYSIRGRLINHIIKKHYDRTNVLLEADRQTVFCIVCNRHVIFSKLYHLHRHFERHRDNFLKVVKEKSDQPLMVPGEEHCIFCKKVYSCRQYVCLHVKSHSFSDIFISDVRSETENNLLDKNHCASKNSSIGAVYGDVNISVISENLSRVCLLCQTSFSESSLYQAHLKTHLKQCRVIVHDLHNETKSTNEWAPVENLVTMEGYLNEKKKDDDDGALIDFTNKGISCIGQKLHSNQMETLHTDSISEDITFLQEEKTDSSVPESVDRANNFKMCTQYQNMAKLKNLVSSELQSAASRAEALKFNKYTSLMSGLQTNCVTDDNDSGKSNTAREIDCTTNISSSNNVLNKAGNVHLNYLDDFNAMHSSYNKEKSCYYQNKARNSYEPEKSPYENSLHKGKNEISACDGKDGTGYSQGLSDYNQRLPWYSDLFVHQTLQSKTKESQKRTVDETSHNQEMWIEPKRSKISPETSQLQDSVLMENQVNDEQLGCSEEVLVIKSELLDSSQVNDSQDINKVYSSESVSHSDVFPEPSRPHLAQPHQVFSE